MMRTLLTLATITMLTACASEPRRGWADVAAAAGPGGLGAVELETTCDAGAKPHFLRGLAALHSFWYPVALEEFRAATRVDPTCMMGYWGEAMSHNHPIWGDPSDTEAARAVLEKIRMTPELTPRERAWLGAVQVLYGPGDKATRDQAYAAAMERLHRDDPSDPEAALFYALALMGAIEPGDPDALRTRLGAGAIAAAVFETHPDHPGAAHYVIHAYDDPAHARRALPAARRYAEIAPAAPHALHMPSHIFLQLGMWPEAAASNEAAWAASDRWVRQRELPVSERDYHSLHWLMYALLQQGRPDRAEAKLTLMRESVAGFPRADARALLFGTYTHAAMAATFVVETARWDAAERWLPPVQTGEGPAQLAVAQIPAIFARGLAAAARGAPDEARQSAERLRAMRTQAPAAPGPFVEGLLRLTEIQELQIEAMTAAARGDLDQAIGPMRKATALEAALPPPSGPPQLIKPSHELFGEILLRAGRPAEAAEQFAIALRRHPNRARSVAGAASAAARAEGPRAPAASETPGSTGFPPSARGPSAPAGRSPGPPGR